MKFNEGEKGYLIARFADDNDNPTDPSTPVEVTVRAPGGESETFTASQDGVGIYQYQYTFEQSGKYYYKFTSADGASEQGELQVIEDKTKN